MQEAATIQSAGRSINEPETVGNPGHKSGILVPELCPAEKLIEGSGMNDYATAMGDWLDGVHDWNYWVTLTQRPKENKRDNSRYAGGLGRDWDGQRGLQSWRRALESWKAEVRPTAMFWGTESGTITGRNHIHGLLYFNTEPDPERFGFSVHEPSAQAIWAVSHRMFGRAHVDEFKKELGAAHYVSKYVTKRLADYDIWTP